MSRVPEEITNIKSHIADRIDDAYYIGYADGQKSYGNEIRTRQDVEEAYKMGMERAWDTARRIVLDPQDGGYKKFELNAIFGEYDSVEDIIADLDVREAIMKEESYTKRRIEK